MTIDQIKPRAGAALLRAAGRGAAQETESLCCEAAGITFPLRGTEMVFVPHEKLRGAAKSEVTLNAWERPLAQPALGYKQIQLKEAA
ncbi:hypothetical protein [Pseudomonas sp. NA-150]|uniref:hypothetical protein n=1 Tax=Pseudomonas sp. NA-150 TaxID=3367525 RepID=UPI0037C72682